MIDILVPVLARPWNVEPFIASLSASTTSEHRVIFICSPSDPEQLDTCFKSGKETWLVPWEAGRADYAKKINWAFERTHGEWVFQGADDVRFSLGWDTHALKLGERFSVIGTNDLHNPAVKRGLHSTHLLFRREYIENYGGTFDGSGTVFSEAYDHQFVDNEFISTAKRRGQWAFARRSVVEHLHPVWGLNQWDSTYEKAFRETSQDQRLFVRRTELLRRMSRRRNRDILPR